ncbi:MAG: ribosomal-protein-alanine N-acetyltransferase [Cyclobacteriaceae bacterium]|jgi:ribosomal-protein-alanine N-acetyltransferase
MISHKSSFSTERLLIRKLEYSDAADIFSTYASNPNCTRYISWPTHQTIDDTHVFLKAKIENWGDGPDHPYALVDKATNQFIGSIGFVAEGRRVFVGYIIAPNMEGKGFASEAARCIVEYLHSLNYFSKIWACCAVENEASAKVLQNAGMEREALVHNWINFINLNDRYLDCYFYNYPLNK